MSERKIMAGECGPCRNVHGRPLFAYLRSVKNCKGSKINHLLDGGQIAISRVNFDNYSDVVRRMLRDAPMPASEFLRMAQTVTREYGVPHRSFEIRGEPDFTYFGNSLVGDVRLVDGRIAYTVDREVAEARDAEFKKPKYKKMSDSQVGFLVSLFELTELTKQISRGKK